MEILESLEAFLEGAPGGLGDRCMRVRKDVITLYMSLGRMFSSRPSEDPAATIRRAETIPHSEARARGAIALAAEGRTAYVFYEPLERSLLAAWASYTSESIAFMLSER